MATIWIFTNTNNEEKAKLVVERIAKGISYPMQILSIEAYPKIKGHKIRASFVELDASWPEIVLDTIQKAQELGRGWALSGDIRQEVDMVSKEAKSSGVEMLHIQRARQ